LLLCEGHAGREGSDVPVNVSVRLLTSQAEDVEPFGGHDAADRLSDAVHDAL